MNKNLYKATGLLVQAPGAASLRFRLDHIFLVLAADFGPTTKREHHKQGRQAVSDRRMWRSLSTTNPFHFLLKPIETEIDSARSTLLPAPRIQI
jgi:hypothetical protein